MTATSDDTRTDEAPQTGHRPGRRPEEPRNSTVCFTVTEHEKTTIDALSHCICLRRSAILTEIVTRFLVAAQSPNKSGVKRTALYDFLDECQEGIAAKRNLFESLAKQE